MRLNMSAQRRAAVKVILVAVLAFGFLCPPICDLNEHHGQTMPHAFLCTIDMPQVFQLLILMNSLVLAMLAGVLVLPSPAFPLLKPPRVSLSR